MARKPQGPPPQPPNLSPIQAIALLRRQIERAVEIRKLHYADPQIDGWTSTTETILHGAFGKTDGYSERRTDDFNSAFGGSIRINMHPSEIQRNHQIRMDNRVGLLKAYVEQLEDGIPPAIATGIDQYRFHSAIEEVAGRLLRDGHYKQAALEAYIRVISEVKMRTNRPDLDGDGLMNHAFGAERQQPILRFNSLQTESERDEQKGFLFLFKGIVGLRNSKAHSNTLFDSPQRAHEYIALASLLMRLLEVVQS